MEALMSTEQFREEVRDWLESNCPESMRQGSVHFEDAYEVYQTDDALLWQERAATRGWTAPTWPTEYGGGGMDASESRVFWEEMARIKALPASTGMGLAMIGPTILEMGTEEQKARHIPKIVTGEAQWCQGYSEPGAGSDREEAEGGRGCSREAPVEGGGGAEHPSGGDQNRRRQGS